MLEVVAALQVPPHEDHLLHGGSTKTPSARVPRPTRARVACGTVSHAASRTRFFPCRP
jgi:hypothetical protein